MIIAAQTAAVDWGVGLLLAIFLVGGACLIAFFVAAWMDSPPRPSDKKKSGY